MTPLHSPEWPQTQMASPRRPVLSVVSTMYCSEPYIEEFYRRISKAARDITADYELILVNDGSPDESLSRARQLCKSDPLVRVLDLSRNFGHHKALLTGLSYAHGEFVFVIDSDLEEPPELLAQFWQEMQQSPDVDVLYGVQASRKGGWFERHSGRLFYLIFNALSETRIPRDAVMARLMRHAYVESLVEFQEQDVVLSGIYALAGFNQKAITVVKGHKDATTYTLPRKIEMMVNAITSYSAKPLVWIFYVGAAILAISLLTMTGLAYKKVVLGVREEGWTSVIVSVWFFGGLIVFCQGIIGIYLAKVFEQVKNRPRVIIKNEFGGPGEFQEQLAAQGKHAASPDSEFSFAPPSMSVRQDSGDRL